jgi:hypothetical protein
LPISASEVVSPAFQQAKRQLLQPFRFAQWMRLALVGVLAGEMSSGGCNFNYSVPSSHHPSQGSHALLNAPWPQFAQHPAMLAALFTFLFILLIVWMGFFMYVNSMMRFILFDSVVAGECHIRQGWVRRERPGLRLFVWQILFSLITFAALFILIAVPAACAWGMGWFTQPREHLLPLILSGIVLFFVLFVFVVVINVIHVMTKDFVVSQMALEDISALEGWRRLSSLLKKEKGGYAGYIGIKIVLAIAAGIGLGIITLIVVLILLVPIVGLGVIVMLSGVGVGVGLTWNFYTIALAVVAASIVIAVLMFVVALIYVPAIVFFSAYSIYFFAPRYPPLASLLWPQSAPPAPFIPGAPTPLQSPPTSPA